jgi:hypothetical protein
VSEPAVKIFRCHEITQAVEHARSGGIAVHLHWIVFPDSPRCFRRDVEQGLPIAHVFGTDAFRLRTLARRLGVRVVVIDREGTDRQHVDLCGTPLRKLLHECGVSIENHRIPKGDL